MITTYLQSLAGGMLLGLSAVLLLVFNGRIAGISGIVGRLLGGKQIPANAVFVVGLVLGPIIYAAIYGSFPRSRWLCPGPSSSWQDFWSASERGWDRAAHPVMASSAWRGFPGVR